MNNDEFWKLPSLILAKSQPVKSRNFDLAEQYRSLGLAKKYYLRTYGCQANLRDSEIIAGILQQLGFTAADSVIDSDLIVLNSCAVRKNAEDKVIGEIGALKKLKRAKPSLIIALAGCMAQEAVMVDLVLAKYPQVDLVFGTNNIDRLPELLAECYRKQGRVVQVHSQATEIVEAVPSIRKDGHKAWINIMYGCDKYCSYCIVPFTRGQQRSRQMDEILKEVNDCLHQGYQEVTLLGQNVNAYGKDLGLAGGFALLLEQVARTGIKRIRFVTSHPWDFSQDMLEMMVKYNNIMPYLHLPLQSGDDEILRKMGRRYSSEQYLALFNRLKEALPHLAFSTDIIVGFPGESADQFANTMRLVEYCRFDNIYSFIYSPRVGTKAAEMVDDVPLAEKKVRLKQLNEVFKAIAYQNAQAYLGQKVEVLVDGPSQKKATVYSGYTATNKLVNFAPSEETKAGDFVEVLITKAQTFTLEGRQE